MNIGSGKYHLGRPSCTYKGKTVPWLVGFSEGGGISGNSLTDVLRHLEDFKLYDNDKKTLLFLCCWLMGMLVIWYSFLKFICGENHKWTVVFGVTYETSLWQVGDSTYQNGTYKIHPVKAKHEIITHGIEHLIGDMELILTDIMPFINKAWVKPFAEVKSKRRSIAERGRFPYYRNILMHK